MLIFHWVNWFRFSVGFYRIICERMTVILLTVICSCVVGRHLRTPRLLEGRNWKRPNDISYVILHFMFCSHQYAWFFWFFIFTRLLIYYLFVYSFLFVNRNFYRTVRTVAKAFLKLGLEKYHSVCILGLNSPEWLLSSFGAMLAG